MLATPFRTQRQADERIRHWVRAARLHRWLWVATLEDGSTVHNSLPWAFLDRRFKP